MIPSAAFVGGVALQNKFPLSSKFSRNPGSMPKTHTHVLSTSVKYMARFLVKSFGGVAGVRCWRLPLAGRQVTVFLLRRLCSCSITIVQRWRWTPTMVCAVTTPLHSLYQGSTNYGPRAKSDLRSHFTRPQNTFCQYWKNNMFAKSVLIW